MAIKFVVGLMSGTSRDGVDAALIKTDGLNSVDAVAFQFEPYPDDLKAVVQDAADQSKVHNRALNRKMNAEYLEKLKEKMDVVILTPEQKAAFQKACQPIYEQFGKDIGEDLIKEVQELSAAFKK